MRIKTKLVLALLMIALFVIPSYSFATNIVFETSGWIIGTDSNNYSFTADKSPYVYRATLADLSTPPQFGFDDLYLGVTYRDTSPYIKVSLLVGPGSFDFEVLPSSTINAVVSGIGGGSLDSGLYGLEVRAVPEPTTMLLFGAGLVGLAGFGRKKFKK